MVFQRPTRLPLSIRDNVLRLPAAQRRREQISSKPRDEIVEGALRQVLCGTVKDRLDAEAISVARRATEAVHRAAVAGQSRRSS